MDHPQNNKILPLLIHDPLAALGNEFWSINRLCLHRSRADVGGFKDGRVDMELGLGTDRWHKTRLKKRERQKVSNPSAQDTDLI